MPEKFDFCNKIYEYEKYLYFLFKDQGRIFISNLLRELRFSLTFRFDPISAELEA